MNTLNPRILCLLFVSLGLSFLTSCGDDGDPAPAGIPPEIVGEWEFYSATGTVTYTASPAINVVGGVGAVLAGTTMTYNANGTFTNVNPATSTTDNGKFRFEGINIVHYDYSSGGFYWDGPIDIDGDEFTVTITEEMLIPNLVAGGMTPAAAAALYDTYNVTYTFKKE